MNEPKKLLSICIPTYNRAKILDKALYCLNREVKSVDVEQIEIFISDNNSPDETFQVVQKYIRLGMPLKYLKNERNIGADGNFKKCIDNAKGKYLWILGDDDFLKEGTLTYVLYQLKGKSYGLVHFSVRKESYQEKEEYNEVEKFLNNIGYWITFISSNIVQIGFVSDIDFEKYMGSHFIQMPLYIVASKKYRTNMIVHRQIFEDPADSETNGGYNFFEVFVVNYLSIRRRLLSDTKDEKCYFKKEKKNLFNNFLLGFIYKLYFKREKGRFKTEGGLRILFRYYGTHFYFYKGIFKLFIKKIIGRK